MPERKCNTHAQHENKGFLSVELLTKNHLQTSMKPIIRKSNGKRLAIEWGVFIFDFVLQCGASCIFLVRCFFFWFALLSEEKHTTQHQAKSKLPAQRLINYR